MECGARPEGRLRHVGTAFSWPPAVGCIILRIWGNASREINKLGRPQVAPTRVKRPGRPRKPELILVSEGTGQRNRVLILALSKALHLLTFSTQEHPDWSLGELVEETGLNRANVYRILRTMEHDRFLGLDPETGRYHLGPAMYPTAYLTQAHSELVRTARPHLESLAEATGETAALAGDVDGWVVIVDQVLTSHPSKPELPLGRALGV